MHTVNVCTPNWNTLHSKCVNSGKSSPAPGTIQRHRYAVKFMSPKLLDSQERKKNKVYEKGFKIKKNDRTRK
jgi:hypothetical protein